MKEGLLRKGLSHHEIPNPLTNWRNMSCPQLEEAFPKCPSDFQRKVYTFVGRTETNLQWYLACLEWELQLT
jgi:hypothetical protein